MEGIIAKRKESIYQPGGRTSDWLKIKARLQQEFVVGGFPKGKGSRKNLGALLLGAYRNGKLYLSDQQAMEVARQMFPGLKPHIERIRNVKTGGRDQWRDER
jgi:ATP-dependent DNA ligase